MENPTKTLKKPIYAPNAQFLMHLVQLNGVLGALSHFIKL